MLNREVGFALNNGHRQPRLAGPKSAQKQKWRAVAFTDMITGVDHARTA